MNQKEQEREWNQEDMAKYEKWLQEETREEAAKMVLRSMVADMRRQGWSLSNEAADQMVAKLSAEILALESDSKSKGDSKKCQ